jgi:pimeloyl-ACP methyl ester carboxylesterase
MTDSKKHTIVVVHGTYASASDWWSRSGSFVNQLDDDLKKKHCSARCWQNSSEPFSWSGENSELARMTASHELESYLLDLENDEAIEKYHVVAHSHGGNVALRALMQIGYLVLANPEASKLGCFITLGTPFTSKNYDSDDGRRVRWAKFVLLFFSSTIVFIISATLAFTSVIERKSVETFLIIYFIFHMLIYTRMMFGAAPNAYVGLLIHPLFSRYDEAFHILSKAVRQRNTLSLVRTWKSKLKLNVSILRILNRKAGFWSIFDDERARDLIRRAGRLAGGDMRVPADRPGSDTGAILRFLIFTTIWGLMSVRIFFLWLLDVSVGRLARTYVIRRSIATLLGDNFPGERIEAVLQEPPNDICDLMENPFSDELEERMFQIAISDFSKRFEGVYSGIADNEFSTGEEIRDLLKFKSVHSQYYENDEVISLVSSIISQDSCAFLGMDGYVQGRS